MQAPLFTYRLMSDFVIFKLLIMYSIMEYFTIKDINRVNNEVIFIQLKLY